MTRATITCADCRSQLLHAGRGLCTTCYERHRDRGTLINFERVTRPDDELLAEWSDLRRDGYDMRQAAERIGVTHAALERAIYRARRRGDARAITSGVIR